MINIINSAIKSGISYKQYRSMINHLLSKGMTSGIDHSQKLLQSTKLNVSRMNRLDKTIVTDTESLARIKNIFKPQIWLLIAEAWCGDASQVLPTINHLGEQNELVKVVYVLRDEQPGLIDQFLTNGGRSIPIVIIIDEESREVIGHWGPRPEYLMNLAQERVNSLDPMPLTDFHTEVHKWYAKDKTLSTQKEFSQKVKALTLGLPNLIS